MAVVLDVSWTPTVQSNGDVILTGTSLLNEAVDTQYTNAFQVSGRDATGHRYVGFMVTATTVSGTNLDIALYGSMTDESSLTGGADGNKVLLLDTIVADVTNGTVKGGIVDMALYPYPYYYVSVTTDADEKANTGTFKVFIPHV